MAQQSIEERVAALEQMVARLQAEHVQGRAFEALRVEVTELRLRYQAHEEYVSDRLNTFEDHITVRLEVLENNLAARLSDHDAHFHVLETGQQEHARAIATLQAGQQAHTAAIVALAGEVRELQAGQQHIIEILTGGRPKRND